MLMNNQYLITVCTVHYRKLPQLKNTIECLEKNTFSKIRIKILNQGYEANGIKEYLDKINKSENVEVIFSKKNIGASQGRDILSQDIDTPFIMMLDDDIYVNKEWDVPVIEYFKNHPEIGVISFSIFRNNGEFWFTGGQFINLKGKTIKTKRVYIDPETTDQKFIVVDDVCVGAMIYKNELKNIISWDPYYFVGFEDLEKGIYLKKSKYKCAVSIQSRFIHDCISIDRTTKVYNKHRRDYHKLRKSYLHFSKKWGYHLPLSRHFFYKYICLLPNSGLQNFAYLWLNKKTWRKKQK